MRRTVVSSIPCLKILSRSLICHLNLNIILLNIRYCEAFPAIKGAIQRVKREKDRVKQKGDDEKSSKSSSKSALESKTKPDVVSASTKGTKDFTLQRRLSTATDVKYDMYLINVGTMLKLFGSHSDREKISISVIKAFSSKENSLGLRIYPWAHH